MAANEQTEKPTWSAPELIVLARSKPGEAVLAVCKLGPPSAGPNSVNNSCHWELLGGGCGECSSMGAS
jgi:hypothetical protein